MNERPETRQAKGPRKFDPQAFGLSVTRGPCPRVRAVRVGYSEGLYTVAGSMRD
jgi:hypothetical protein